MIIKAEDKAVLVQYRNPSKYYVGQNGEADIPVGKDQVAGPFDEVRVEPHTEFQVPGALIAARELGLGTPDEGVDYRG